MQLACALHSRVEIWPASRCIVLRSGWESWGWFIFVGFAMRISIIILASLLSLVAAEVSFFHLLRGKDIQERGLPQRELDSRKKSLAEKFKGVEVVDIDEKTKQNGSSSSSGKGKSSSGSGRCKGEKCLQKTDSGLTSGSNSGPGSKSGSKLDSGSKGGDCKGDHCGKDESERIKKLYKPLPCCCDCDELPCDCLCEYPHYPLWTDQGTFEMVDISGEMKKLHKKVAKQKAREDSSSDDDSSQKVRKDDSSSDDSNQKVRKNISSDELSRRLCEGHACNKNEEKPEWRGLETKPYPNEKLEYETEPVLMCCCACTSFPCPCSCGFEAKAVKTVTGTPPPTGFPTSPPTLDEPSTGAPSLAGTPTTQEPTTAEPSLEGSSSSSGSDEPTTGAATNAPSLAGTSSGTEDEPGTEAPTETTLAPTDAPSLAGTSSGTEDEPTTEAPTEATLAPTDAPSLEGTSSSSASDEPTTGAPTDAPSLEGTV